MGRCEASVTPEILTNYIKSDLKVNVVNCECISVENLDTKSFKVSVASSDRDSLLKPDLWPENIHIRKYFKARKYDRK